MPVAGPGDGTRAAGQAGSLERRGSSYFSTLANRRRCFPGSSPALPVRAQLAQMPGRCVTSITPSVPACWTVPHVTSRFRRLLLLGAALLVAVALAACGSSSSPSTHPGSTTTVPASRETSFYPFTAQGALSPGLQVTQNVSGTCSGPGVAGAGSYRCTSRHGSLSIDYDPCFAPPAATSGALLCAGDPTDIDVIRLTTGALPKTPAATPERRVWALRLESGAVCVLAQEPSGGFGSFVCPTSHAKDAVADCRTPSYGAHGWSTECQATEGSSFRTLRAVNVWS
jgi:hypothetical protein